MENGDITMEYINKQIRLWDGLGATVNIVSLIMSFMLLGASMMVSGPGNENLKSAIMAMVFVEVVAYWATRKNVLKNEAYWKEIKLQMLMTEVDEKDIKH